MAGVAPLRTSAQKKTLRPRRPSDARQSGQVLLDALLAVALLATALPTLTATARSLVLRAQERHGGLLRLIEAENARAYGRTSPDGE